MKKKRLLNSFSFIDDQYVKEAEPKMKNSTSSLRKTIGRVACFAILVALSLYLFIPFSTKGPDLSAYANSEYYPIIERISANRNKPSPYKNNFEYITAEVGDFFDSFGGMMKEDADFGAAGDNMVGSADGSTGNGSYEEMTDNQVNGVIEADLQKRTDKYIFRLGLEGLKVYSIDGDETKRVADFILPSFADEYSTKNYEREMYLSEDGNTVTIISPYTNDSYNSNVGIISLDVSDLNDIKVNKTISIDGRYNSSRMVDGRLLLISDFHVYYGDIDYAVPETFVPTITDGDVKECIKFEDIIYPDSLNSAMYSVVALMEEDSLELIKANALLDYYHDIYVSENNVYVTKEYVKTKNIGEKGAYVSVNTSEIAILGYSGETLDYKGAVTVEGYVKDQYSMDEYEGHIRVVTSTNNTVNAKTEEDVNKAKELIGEKRLSANLTVFNLQTLEKVGEVKHFAPEGEEAASVRFDDDSAYVCTAVVVTLTDPVYFFDLSDYSNITYTDTGVIDGFSTSLIELGEGFLLGIGRENWSGVKLEVYEEVGDKVVSVDKLIIDGSYSENYKSYYIDRSTNIFGLGVEYIYDEATGRSYSAYVLLCFNDYEIVEIARIKMNFDSAERIRAFVKDGYLYITDDKQIVVESINN